MSANLEHRRAIGTPEQHEDMTRRSILIELGSLTVARLFRSRRWLADSETAAILETKLLQMGLEELVPGDTKTFRATSLGRELRVDLLMTFIGLFDEWEIPRILEEHALIPSWECLDLEDRLGGGADPEILLRERVQRAYYQYYNPFGRLS